MPFWRKDNPAVRQLRKSQRLSLQVFQTRIRLFGILSIGEEMNFRNISAYWKGNLNYYMLVPLLLIVLREPLSHLARCNSYNRVCASVIVGRSVKNRVSQ